MSEATVRVGDWRDLARGLTPGSVDFVYADPPFNTGAAKRTPPGARAAGRETRAGYEDSWADAAAHAGWLRERVVATLPAVRATGLVALHVDWRSSHHVRLMLDEVLGADRFVNHLVWSYGLGGSSARRFARKHDDILLYCIEPGSYWFEAPRVAATSRRMRGKTKKATDVLEIPSINNMARERTGYPTQKPRALLEVLVGACCPPGGLVLDPCCGSGTTLEAAWRLGRRWLGFDVSAAAVRVARGRLAACAGAAGESGALRPVRDH
ncbi:MAG: site-specific DNA-methyltransferase [Planctomycetota bacterium]|nr:site-specific DNA-methyltransferase [Planctomycetota bacterium]